MRDGDGGAFYSDGLLEMKSVRSVFKKGVLKSAWMWERPFFYLFTSLLSIS